MGYDEWTISQRLGNVPTTASKTYIHASSKDDEEVAKALKRKTYHCYPRLFYMVYGNIYTKKYRY